MNSDFEHYLRSHTCLSEEATGRLRSLAKPRKLRRNELLLQQGEVCQHKAFVVNGLLRTFGLTPAGDEHIVRFSPEESWTLDKESYDRQTPAATTISAVEPSVVLLWAKADFDQLVDELPQLKSFTEQLTAHNMYRVSQRLLTALSATAEEKYDAFLHDYPDLLRRVPLKMVAAYLGLSLRTLDRIRHAQAARS